MHLHKGWIKLEVVMIMLVSQRSMHVAPPHVVSRKGTQLEDWHAL